MTTTIRPPKDALLGERIHQFATDSGSIARKAQERVARLSMETKDAIGDIIAETHKGEQSTGDGDHERTQLFYESSLWVYAAAYAIASNLAGVPLVATRRDGANGIVDAEDSELQALIDAPGSGGLTRYDLVEQLTIYLKLTGSAFVYADRGGEDRPEIRVRKTAGPISELRVLRTSRMAIEPDPSFTGGIKAYQHSVGQSVLHISPQNIGAVRLFNPNDDYWGLSPLSMVLKSIEIDSFAENWNRALVESGGAPDAIAETENSLNRASKNRLRHEWSTRFQKGKRGGLVVLDSGLKLRPAGFSPKEMEFSELIRIAQQRILALFGVPPLLVMDLRDASVLANADTQKKLFWTQTVQPTGDRISAALTRLLRTDPRFPSTDGWGVRFRWEDVADLVTIDEERVAKEHYAAGGLRLDEYRGRIGERPVGTEFGGDDFYTAPTSSPFGGLLSSAPGTTKVLGGSGIVVPSREAKGLARASFRRLVREHYPELRAATAAHFDDQADRVVDRLREELRGGKSARAKGLDADDLLALIWPQTEEDRALQERIGPVFLGAVLDAGNMKLEQLFPDTTIDALEESTDRIRSLLDGWAAARVTAINEATRDAIRETLRDSILAADTNAEMERRLLEVFGSYNVGPAGTGTVETRAERIARTEVGTALNSGSYTAALEARSLGLDLRKSWLSARDSRVRDSHDALDSRTTGSPIPIDEPFSNGLQYPNDYGGPASEVINCRCSMVEVVVE